MKKTIELYYCDDCGEEIDVKNGEKHASITIKHGSFNEYFLMCLDCLSARVCHSISIVPNRKDLQK